MVDLSFADGPRDLVRLFVVVGIGGAVIGTSMGRGRASSSGRVTVMICTSLRVVSGIVYRPMIVKGMDDVAH